jgi:hypothetical protein
MFNLIYLKTKKKKGEKKLKIKEEIKIFKLFEIHHSFTKE